MDRLRFREEKIIEVLRQHEAGGDGLPGCRPFGFSGTQTASLMRSAYSEGSCLLPATAKPESE